MVTFPPSNAKCYIWRVSELFWLIGHFSKSFLTDAQAKSRWKRFIRLFLASFSLTTPIFVQNGSLLFPLSSWIRIAGIRVKEIWLHLWTIHPLIYPRTSVIRWCQSQEAVNKLPRFKMETSTSIRTVGQLSSAMPVLRLSSILNVLIRIHSPNLNRPHWSSLKMCQLVFQQLLSRRSIRSIKSILLSPIYMGLVSLLKLAIYNDIQS